MNSYGLRIKASENKNTASGISFETVVIPDGYNYMVEKHEHGKSFVNSSAEQQVAVVKNLLNNTKESYDDDIVTLLVIIYLCADAKHPVKCIITRFVTKNSFIQESFKKALTTELLLLINENHTDYKAYVKVIGKIASCIENFPVGAAAVKNVETEVGSYLKNCLVCCVSTLSNDKLTPTGRNEVYSLSHTVLRLLLYIIQKIDKENMFMTSMLKDIRSCLKQLLYDDSPMDTKSVCGILLVSMHVMENGSDSWIDILAQSPQDDVKDFLSNDSSKLSMYSALVTVVSMENLNTHCIDSAPAIVKLTDNILDLGDRYSSESTFTLGIARTIVQISKGLEHFGDSGLYLLDRLFVFVWSHLEHTTDSVQHLSAQILNNIVKYCAHLRKRGNEVAMDKLFSTLSSLERTRKCFYLSLTALTNELGSECVLKVWPNIIEETMNVLHVQAVQASATTSLEALIRQSRSEACAVGARWVGPALRCARAPAARAHALTGLLLLLVRKDAGVVAYILPHISQASQSTDAHELTCVLMLLSVVRQAGHLPGGESGDKWRHVIGYDVLKGAAVHASDEIRFLSLSLIVESPKSTEAFTKGELEFIIWFITYNINAQAAHFRQLVLSLMKKFLKRLEQSYRSLTRENLPNGVDIKGDYYVHFVDKLTDLCFECIAPGGNHNRRHVALQLLVWLGRLEFEGIDRHNLQTSKGDKLKGDLELSERVSTLLDLLGDSYESNKEMALQLLFQCPSEVLYSDKYASALHLESVIEQASSMKPTECVTAGYKLQLLTKKLTRYIDAHSPSAAQVTVSAVERLCAEAERQVSARGAGPAHLAPLYGVLHCLARALQHVAVEEWSERHSQTCVRLVRVCARVCACAGPVVSSAAPEGHLPLQHGKIRLEDGSEATAQMVLLCAWRSVKEVSLILSTIVSKVTRSNDRDLKMSMVKEIGGMFLELLTETKHRGAFEQIYVGFSRMLTCLWRDTEPELNQLPKRWLSELMSDIESGHSNDRLCSTRRSAGLPFMIQALVSSEVRASPGAFARCVLSLERACGGRSLRTRCHALNILRALYRGAASGAPAPAHLAPALRRAVTGCESDAWIERNSSTLLFAALVVRVFGVTRSKDSERLCVRNRMTGRIFFLKYPELYDFMLDKLQEATAHDALHPALYPVLLLLARLYPSALEGSVSILKLESFVPGVLRCARGRAAAARALAARALPPLIPHTRYLSQLEEMFTLLRNRSIKRNFCHGVLLQIIKLLDARPDSPAADDETRNKLTTLIKGTFWILEQSVSDVPCYVIADEFIKLIHIAMKKFNLLTDKSDTCYIKDCLTKMIFNKTKCTINPGRELCLADAVYLHLILHIYDNSDVISPFVYECLSHDTYEVVLAMLNYLLIVQEELEPENSLQEHIKLKRDVTVLESLKSDPKYIQVLCKVLKDSKYLECIQKCLLVLTLEPNTQKDIVLTKTGVGEITDELIVMKFIDYIGSEHENFTHIYLKSLTSFCEGKFNSMAHSKILEALRTIFSCSLSDNSDETRGVVVLFLENNLERLLNFKFDELSEADTFELRATVWCTCVALLEDDDSDTRARVAHAVAVACDVTPAAAARDVTPAAGARDVTRAVDVVAARAKDFVLEYVRSREAHAGATLAVLALVAFDCEVCVTDEVGDECRVFDHNEKYNTNLEEGVWSRACADVIGAAYAHAHADLALHLCDVIEDGTYKQTFRALCGDNVEAYRSIVKFSKYIKDSNPKVDIFVKRLRAYQSRRAIFNV